MQTHTLINSVSVPTNTTYYSPALNAHQAFSNERLNLLASITHGGGLQSGTNFQVTIQGSLEPEEDTFTKANDFVGDYSIIGWIKQGLIRATNVDFLCIGDSNMIYTPGNGGYLSALWNAFSVRLYSSALYPQIAPGAIGWLEPRFFFADPGDGDNQSGANAFYAQYLSAGSTQVPTGKPIATGGAVNGYGQWRTHAQQTPNTYFYRAFNNGSVYNVANGNESIGLFNGGTEGDHPLFNVSGLVYRSTAGVFNRAQGDKGGEYMQIMADSREPRLEFPIRPSTGFVRTSNLSTYRGVEARELTIPSTYTFSLGSGGSGSLQSFSNFGHIAAQGAQYGSEVRVKDEYVGYWQSVFRRVGGFGINSLEVEGGRPGRYHAEALAAVPDKALHLYLSEIRNRQISAKGVPGKTVVVIQEGINDRIDSTLSVGPNPAPSNTGAGFVDNIRAMIERITSCWVAQGFPSEDLGFLVFVAHPVVSTDNTGDTVMQQFNEALKTAFANNKNKVLIYDMRLGIGNGAFFSSAGYHASPDTHLTAAGYAAVANDIYDFASSASYSQTKWTTLGLLTPTSEAAYYGSTFNPDSRSMSRYVASMPYMRFAIRNAEASSITVNATLTEKP